MSHVSVLRRSHGVLVTASCNTVCAGVIEIHMYTPKQCKHAEQDYSLASTYDHKIKRKP